MKFSKKEWSYIFYDFAESVHSVIILSVILPLVFKSVASNAGIIDTESTALWGYANTFGTLLVALLAPVLGSIANFKDYKKKLFMAFLMVGIFFTGMIGFVPENGWVTMLILFTLSLIGYTGANIFYDSFLMDVTTPDRYDQVSTAGFALGYIGGMIPLVISLGLIMFGNHIGISGFLANRLSFIITAAWWFVFAIPFMKNVNQTYEIEKPKHPIKQSFKVIIDTFKEVHSYQSIFIFLIAYFFYIDGVNTIIKMATSYGSDLGISDTVLIFVLILTQLVAFPFSLLFGWLAKKTKPLYLLFISIFIYTFITVFAFFIKDQTGFFILAMLVATCQGGIQALSRSYFASLIPQDKANEFFGFYNVFGRFSAILGPFLVAFFTNLTGKTNYGVLSLLLLFGLGTIFLTIHYRSIKNQ